MHASVKEMTKDELNNHVIDYMVEHHRARMIELNIGGDVKTAAKIGRVLKSLGFTAKITRKGGGYDKVWSYDVDAAIRSIDAEIKKLEQKKIRLNAQKAPNYIRNDALFRSVVEYAVSHDICFVDAIIQHYKWGTTNGEKARVKKILEAIGLPQKEFRKVGFG